MKRLPRFDHEWKRPTFKEPAGWDEPPVITGLEACPDCGGEGRVFQEVSGGRWNSYIGTWEPDEYEVPCETCGGDPDVGPSRFRTNFGTGTIRVERCGFCGHPTEGNWSDHGEGYCECDEDTLLIEHNADNQFLMHLRGLAFSAGALSKLGVRPDPVIHGLEWNHLHRLAARFNSEVTYSSYVATEITLDTTSGPVRVLLFAEIEEA